MKVMDGTKSLAANMISLLDSSTSREDFELASRAFSAGDYLESIYNSSSAIIRNHVPHAEKLLEEALTVGLKSCYYEAEFRELFSQKVA